jgi:uncharacterized protein YciI
MMAFFCKLHPPRPTFMADMNQEEREVMRRHVEYWRPLTDAGTVIALGPVADPAGGWGLGLMEAESREALEALTAADPAIRSGRGFRYEIHVMPQLVLRKDVAAAAR